MADARHVVEIILQAHDRTAEAFNSFNRNAEQVKEANREIQRQNQESAESFRRISEATRSMTAVEKDLNATRERLNLTGKASFDNLVNLEKASAQYVATNRRVGASEAERAAALEKTVQAQKTLAQALVEEENVSKRQATLRAGALREQAQKLAQSREQINMLKEEAAAEQRLQQEREKRIAQDQRAGQAEQRRVQASRQAADEEIRARQRVGEEIDRQAQRLARQGLGANEARETRDELTRLRTEYQRLGGAGEEAWRRQARAIRQARTDGKAIGDDAKNYLATIRQIADVEERRSEALRAGDQVQAVQLELDARRLRAQAAQVAGELKALFDRTTVNLDLDQGAFTAEAAEVLAIKTALGRDVTFEVKADVDKAMASLRRSSDEGRGFQNFFRGLGDAMSEGFDKSAAKVAAFDNVLRGLFSLGVAAFFGQLILGAGAAGAALLALASSAAFAGGALGGALVAGIAQAIPALGVLATVISRVRAVTEAVKQQSLLQQQEGSKGASAARQQASANDALVAANERVQQATERVTEAREEARRKVEDLILAEQRAVISSKQAQEALQAAIQSGRGATEISSRRLDVREAQQRVTRTREDLAEARTAPGVEDAQQALAQAQRSAAAARRSAEGAAEGVGAAAGKLNFLLAGLSDAERRLFRAIVRLSDAWKTFAKEISEPMINAFTFAVRRVTRLLGDNEIINAARSLSSAMAGQFRRVFSVFTSPEIIDQFARIAKAGSANLKPLGDIAINIGKAFADIAEAAGPALNSIFRSVARLTREFADFAEKGRKSGELGKFFEQGVTHLKAWVGLLGSIGRLFGAIAGKGGGAEAGLDLIKSMTKGINDFAREVGTKGTGANKFFRDLFTVMKQVGDALGIIFKAIGKELARLFGEEAGSGGSSIKGFANIVARVLVPAFFGFIRMMAFATRLVGEFLENNPRVARLVATFLGFGLALSIFGRIRALLAPITGALGFIGRNLGIVFRNMGLVRGIAFNLFPRAAFFTNPFVLLAGVILLVLRRLGLLDDLWRAVRGGFTAFIRAVRPGMRDFLKSIDELVDSLKSGSGLLGILRGPLRLAIRVLGFMFEAMGEIVGKQIGGAFRAAGAVIRIFARLLRGDLRGALDAAIDLIKALASVMLAPFRPIARALRRILGAWADAFTDVLGGLGGVVGGIMDGVVGAFRGGVNLLIDGLNFLIRAINKIPDIDVPGLGEVGIPDLKEVGHWGGGGGGRPSRRNDRAFVRGHAAGGPVIGAGSRDTVPALLTPGEHIWTRSEVQRAGGHEVLFALRHLLGGGGGQSLVPGRFQEGGGVRARGRGQDQGRIAEADLDNLLDIIRAGGSRMINTWRRIWRTIDNTSETRLRSIERDTRRMMGRVADHIENGSRRGLRGLRRAVLSMERVVFSGMDYIADTTNKALKAFDVDPVKVSIRRPRADRDERAGGGFVGQPGERGRDGVRTWLGRGEAVLNYAHQKYIEPAMQAYYGHSLGDTFGRVKGYHAGGPEQTGFAAGGLVPLGNTGRLIDARLENTVLAMMRRWRFALTAAGEGGHSPNSDHHWGGALDIIPGKGGSWELIDQLAKAAGWRPGAPMPSGGPFRWIGWNTEANHGSGNHLHLSWRRGGPFSGPGGEGAADIDIKRLKVEGDDGVIKDLAQNILDKARKAAQKFIEKNMPEAETAGSISLGPGGAAEKIFDYMVKRGFTEEQAAGIVGTFAKESHFSTTVVNPSSGATGLAQWLGGRLTALKSKSNWQSLQTQLDFVWEELMSTEGRAYQAMKGAKTPEQAAQIFDSMYERSDNILDAPAQARAAFQRFGSSQDHGKKNKGDAPSPADAGKGGDKGGKQSFAIGGEVPGDDGQEVPIFAHAGEWILNKRQQRKIAEMAGYTIGKLRDKLGFSGGPSSFQGGGEIFAERSRIRAARRGDYELPDIPLNAFNDIAREVRRMNSSIRRLSRKSKDFTDKFVSNLNEATKEGGLFDQMTANIERFTRSLEIRLQQRVFRFRRGVGVTRAVSEEDEARGQVRNLQQVGRRLSRQDRLLEVDEEELQDQMRRVRRGLVRIQRDGVTKGERGKHKELTEDYQNLFNEFVKVRDKRLTLDEAIIENVKARFEAVQEAIQRTIEKSARPGEEIERALRLTEARGATNTPVGFDLMRQQIGALRQQEKVLLDAYNQASRRGMNEFAREIATQIGDLQITIQEATVNLVRAQVEQVNQAFAATSGFLDLGERLTAVVQGLGNTQGANIGRIRLLQGRRAALQQQQAGLAQLVDDAAAAGNRELVQELNAALGEVNVALAENTLAQRDAVTVWRQTAIDMITGSGAFRTGALGQLGTILQTFATVTQRDTGEQQTAIAQQAVTALVGTGAGLRQKLFEWLGWDLRSLNTEQFAAAFQGILTQYDAIVARFSEQERTTFDGLVNALLENEGATLSAVQALNELTGAVSEPQTFTSSAWQFFREAIFTGMGDVLPQYQIPSMQTGGMVTKSGLFNLHAGEHVVNPGRSNKTWQREGDVNLTINEAGGPIDVTHVASRLAFAKKTRR